VEVLENSMHEEAVDEIAHHTDSHADQSEEDEPSLFAKMFISILIGIMVSVFFLGM
jgi:hypothetical protein